MPTKPTDAPQWATNHTPNPSGTSGDPADENVPPPVSKQESGFGFEEEVPFNWLNWLLYITFQWIEWLNSFNELHEHGISGDYGAPKVSLVQGIAWGDNGEEEVITDTTSLHEIDHRGLNGAQSKRNADIVQVNDLLRFGDTTGQFVDVTDNSSFTDARQLQFVATSGNQGGITTLAFRPGLSQGPGGNFQTLFPMDQSLYIKNLIKAEAVVRIFEQTEAVNNSLIDSYNVSGNILTDTGVDAFYFNLNDDSSFNKGITVGVGGFEGFSSDRFIVEAYYKDNGASPHQIWFQVFRYDNDTDSWVNILTPAAVDPFNIQVTIRVT